MFTLAISLILTGVLFFALGISLGRLLRQLREPTTTEAPGLRTTGSPSTPSIPGPAPSRGTGVVTTTSSLTKMATPKLSTTSKPSETPGDGSNPTCYPSWTLKWEVQETPTKKQPLLKLWPALLPSQRVFLQNLAAPVYSMVMEQCGTSASPLEWDANTSGSRVTLVPYRLLPTNEPVGLRIDYSSGSTVETEKPISKATPAPRPSVVPISPFSPYQAVWLDLIPSFGSPQSNRVRRFNYYRDPYDASNDRMTLMSVGQEVEYRWHSNQWEVVGESMESEMNRTNVLRTS